MYEYFPCFLEHYIYVVSQLNLNRPIIQLFPMNDYV